MFGARAVVGSRSRLEDARAADARGDAAKLAEQLRHFLLLDEDGAGEPVARDAPIDLRRIVVVAHEGHPRRLQLDEHPPQRLAPDAELAREIGLLPRAALEERLVDARERLGLAALAHGGMIRAA